MLPAKQGIVNKIKTNVIRDYSVLLPTDPQYSLKY